MLGARGEGSQSVGPVDPAGDMQIACYILYAIGIEYVGCCLFVMVVFVITLCVDFVSMIVLVFVSLSSAVAMVQGGRDALSSEGGPQLSPGGRGNRGCSCFRRAYPRR